MLGGSPDPFASDPETKRKGMAAFQPTALTISRGDVWANRRAFAEAVLEHRSADCIHWRAGSSPRRSQAADELLGTGRPSRFEDLNARVPAHHPRGWSSATAAADDEELTAQLGELMAAGNKTPGKPADGYDEFLARDRSRTSTPPTQTALTGMIAAAPARRRRPMSRDSSSTGCSRWATRLPPNLMRASALLATHPERSHEVRAEIDGPRSSTDGRRRRRTRLPRPAASSRRCGCGRRRPLFGRVHDRSDLPRKRQKYCRPAPRC